MSCSECRMLEDHVEIAREEVEKIKDRIAAEMAKGAVSDRSMRSLERAERTLEKCQADFQRHFEAAHIGKPEPRGQFVAAS